VTHPLTPTQKLPESKSSPFTDTESEEMTLTKSNKRKGTGTNTPSSSLKLPEWLVKTTENPESTFYLWNLVTANGAPGSPPPRMDHVFVAVGEDLYVFGGGAPGGAVPQVLYMVTPGSLISKLFSGKI
jgi:hypothetical protein